MTKEVLEPSKFKKREDKQEFDSDVDRMLFDVYGESAIEDFNALWKRNPEWPLEKALTEYEKFPTPQQTSFFRTHNLKPIAKELVPHLEKRKDESIEILDIGCSSGQEVYSLAVYMLDAGHSNFKINGIDLSPEMLKRAQGGEYRLDIESLDKIGIDSSGLEKKHIERGYFQDSGKKWKQRRKNYKYSIRDLVEMKRKGQKIPQDAFEEIDQVIIKVSQKLHDRVLFKRHDIIDGPYAGKHDIVVMNHLLLHYPEKTRDKIMRAPS